MAELADRLEHAEQLTRKLQKLNQAHARELRKLLGTPPNPANVGKSFWNRVEKEQADELAAALILIFVASYGVHRGWGDDKPASEVDLRNDKAETWVDRRVEKVTGDMRSHSVDILDAAGKAWDIKIRDGDDIPADEIDQVIDRIFGPGRAEAIGLTETQEAMVNGGRAGVKDSGVEVTVYWGHTSFRPAGHSGAGSKPCPICTPMEGLPQSQWGGKSIPSHPRCDCFEVYVDQDGFVIGTGVPGAVPGGNSRMSWKYRSP